MTTALYKVPARPVLTLASHGHKKADPVVLARGICDPGGEHTTNSATTQALQQLATAFQPAFGHMHMLRDLVIPMYEGSAVPTARFDVALVCEAGVYLFEVKGWRNAVIYRKTSTHTVPRWFLRQHGHSLAREVKDPAWQCGRKTTHLRSLLPADLRVQYFVLLPFEGVELEGVMPTVVITPQDLPYIARVARNNGRNEQGYPRLDNAAIDRTLRLLTDLQGELTVEDHMRNCRNRSPQSAKIAHARVGTAHPGPIKLQ